VGRACLRRHPDRSSRSSGVPGPVHGPADHDDPGGRRDLDEVFDRIERFLDQKVAVGTTKSDDGAVIVRDMTSLASLYLDWLEGLNRDEAYIRNRRSLIDKWILPVIGTVLVEDRSPEHTLQVINNARPYLSPARLEDLGSALSGMKKTAQRKRPGGRWLALDENPLADVEYSRGGTTQGADRNYVQPRYRPATERVEKAIVASRELPVLAWMHLVIAIAAFCALRLSEQLALRAVDIDLRNRQIDINGVWKIEPKAEIRGDRRQRWRSPQTKNKLNRTAPYPGRLHSHLIDACRAALGLPEHSTEADVTAAIERERDRRSALAEDGDWRRVEVPGKRECWLFVDKSGVPPTKERFNDMWIVVRDAIEWPRHIKYRNMRHHAALWWRSKGFDWEQIAKWDGHDVRTLLKYYTLPVEDGDEKARMILDKE